MQYQWALQRKVQALLQAADQGDVDFTTLDSDDCIVVYRTARGIKVEVERASQAEAPHDKLHQLLYEEDALEDQLAALFSLQLDYRCVISWLCYYAWWFVCAVCSSVRDAMQPCVMEPLVWSDLISTASTAETAEKCSSLPATSVHASSGTQSLQVPPASSSPESLSTSDVHGITAAQFSSQLDDIAAIVSRSGVPQNTAALDGSEQASLPEAAQTQVLHKPAYL